MSVFDPVPFFSKATRYMTSVNAKGVHRDHAFESTFMLSLAYGVAGDLERLKPPEPPERPLSFPGSNDGLRDALRRAARARIPGNDDRILLNEHGAWRFARWGGEVEGSNRLVELFTATRSFEKYVAQVAERGEPEDQRAQDARAAISSFVLSEWDYILPDETPNFWGARAVADGLAKMDRVERLPRNRNSSSTNNEPRYRGREVRDNDDNEW